MRTIKLVVIGTSGVGKTSLRGQYISGRFSTGYRATIGADFITKSLPDPKNPTEIISLQIWDTAGQERFSSLSSAFFRGADAVLLMFDVSAPETMHALTKWWAEFKQRVPISDEEVDSFCCVIVGNKMDLMQPGIGVTVEEAQKFVQELVPLSAPEPPQPAERVAEEIIVEDPIAVDDEGTIDEHEPDTDPSLLAPSARIDIQNRRKLSKSRSRSSTRPASAALYGTFRSGLTSFHTPSSSVSDIYASARSSPLPGSLPESPPTVRRMTSLSSTTTTSSSSAATITPSLFMKEQRAAKPPTPPLPDVPDTPGFCLLEPPESGPKLFFTSAKTGSGVSEAFEYIALRVVKKWEYEEAVEARTFHIRDSSDGDTVRLGLEDGGRKWNASGVCCGR
ncbi:ras-domain-containing protein [Suillus paluster]|uniref:ras-domain-containing protein n=1 Tax=Suillus paluster TaxID=48578 RepID=UPI001B887048|nr:ras-domain-containing protein [Suillus paluster]KAG1724826.1 ras-domain-containing protein [Suillus paluster]